MKFVIEGEEEIGSENLGKFLDKYKHMLAADFIVLSDTANFDTGVPALTYQLRGIVQVDLEVKVLDHPVHSGMWGGPVPDPVQVLAALIADLRNKDGSLNIPGLYKDVAKPSKKQLQAHPQAPLRREEVQEGGGLEKGVKLWGEKGYSVYEQLWTRPSLTVIAMESHQIAGSSNQIVDSARARLSPAHGPEHGRHARRASCWSRSSPASRPSACRSRPRSTAPRPGGRPIPTVPPSRRRGAPSRPASRRRRP